MTVEVFRLPDLGEGLTEAEIVAWTVAVGDIVATDDVVAIVETAKASVEVPCPFAGTVTSLHGHVGESLPVGAALVSVHVTASEDDASRDTPGSAAPANPASEDETGSGKVLVGYGTSEATPARRRRVGRARRRSAIPAAADPVLTTAFGERGGEQLLPAVPDAPGAIGVDTAGRAIRVISPLVRRLAVERGVDLRAVTPTAPGGIITRQDVENALPTGPSSPTAGSPQQSAARLERATTPDETRIPLTGIRRAIANTVSTSRREIPDATTWVDADATGLLRLEREIRASTPGAGIGLMALLARLCVAALARYPELNASVDTAAGEIVRHGHVNLSFAADTPNGLLVPVISGAQALTTRELAHAISDLTAAARAGKLTPAQLTGGTFTLNNYGVFGVDGSTPILNYPEAAMLGIGRIVERPWVVRGKIRARPIAQLSLTFDHRVADGGSAGGFLRYVADCIERPGTLLADL